LKAEDKNDIDECFLNMYNTFIHNMSENSIAVIISATYKDELKIYEQLMLKTFRQKFFNYLYQSGQKYISRSNCGTSSNISWWSTINVNNTNLISICNSRCHNFLLLRRKSNVLKKCGQYQDLITLSLGYSHSYTYTNKNLYGDKTRSRDTFFESNNDLNKIIGKKYDYTIVLDSDTIVPKNTIINLIRIAIANPNYVIIQPQINFYNIQTLFQRIQVLWQSYSNISLNYTCSFIGHSPFFGKGLINNQKYFEKCIGPPENPIEYVPIDVLSHDTFESMAAPVLYVPILTFQETLPKTYVSWNIRELRWNIGEIIVASHIYPRLLRRCSSIPNTRNIYNLTFAQAYFALATFRVIVMRPILLSFIIFNIFIPMIYGFFPMLYMIIIVLILPNLIIIKPKKFYETIIILFTSIIQITPEPIIGTFRLIQSCYKLLTNNTKWIPSNKIEQNIKKKGILYYSLLNFGAYSGASIIILYFVYKINLILTLFLCSITFLPFYSSLTGYEYVNKLKNKRSRLAIRRSSRPETQLNTIITNPR